MFNQDRKHKLNAWLSSHCTDVGCYVMLTLLTLFVQFRTGAYQSDMSLDADEPAHAVSSLMVHDYLARWPSATPLAFARDFYNHYPKVAIGHWPPLFYVAEGLWTLVFGRSRVGLLSFVAACGVLLICSVYGYLRPRTGIAIALLGSMMLLFSAPFEQMISAVRPDVLLALLVFGAAVSGGRFMIAYDGRSLILFVTLTITACLVHGRGAVLMLVPFVLLPFTRRKVSWLWITAGVCVLALFLLPPHFEQAYRLSGETIVADARNLLFYGLTLPRSLLLPFLLVGLVSSLRHLEQSTFPASMAALFLSGCLFAQLVPVGWEEYRLITIVPAAAALIALGLHVCAERFKTIPIPGRPWPQAAVAALACASILWSATHTFVKPDLGYHRLVESGLLHGHTVTLVAADPRNEGAMIAEGALADSTALRTVLRSSKSLATMDWDGGWYQEKLPSRADLAKFLDERRVSLVIIELGVPGRIEIGHLRTGLAASPGWTLAKSSNVEIYSRPENGSMPMTALPKP